MSERTDDVVAKYYDKYTEGYLKTYGDTIQAFRPSNTEALHEYVIQHAGLEDGMRILDAGCGVAGPSAYFAGKLNVEIEGITISPEQKRLGDKRLDELGLADRVQLTCGDYHNLTDHFQHESYDSVLFLESLGHAENPDKVLEETWKVLKRQGCIYVKDFFPFEITDPDKQERHQYVIDKINSSYSYNTLDLNSTVTKMRELGFELLFIKKFEFQDDISARENFETMFEIDLFGEMEEFRVAEWLELKFRKPEFDMF